MPATPPSSQTRWSNLRRILSLIAVSPAALAVATVASAEPATVRHAGKTISVTQTLDDPRDLWVVAADLTRINGFVLKPEGACLDEVCIPIRQDRDSELLVTRKGVPWINLSAFARKINQRVTADYDKRIWSFGPLPFRTSGTVASPKKDVQ